MPFVANLIFISFCYTFTATAVLDSFLLDSAAPANAFLLFLGTLSLIAMTIALLSHFTVRIIRKLW